MKNIDLSFDMRKKLFYPEYSLLMAPLSGYTDLAFRRQCRLCGCLYAFTPLVEAGSVVYRNPRSNMILMRGEDEPWLGLQILGADPDLVGECVRMLSDRRFEAVDFNMGCPVPKVTRRGAGAALGENPDLAVRCLERIVKLAPWPVTAKIRILHEVDPLPTLKLAERLEGVGVQALTVHGRRKEKMYSGPVKAEIIKAVKENLSIQVIANGGVVDRDSAAWLREQSGCTRLMLARGAIGNPWLFRQLTGAGAGAPTHEEICSVMYQHIMEMIELYGEDAGLRNARKIILAYLVGRGYRRQRRHQVTSISTCRQFEEFHRAIFEEGPMVSAERIINKR